MKAACCSKILLTMACRRGWLGCRPCPVPGMRLMAHPELGHVFSRVSFPPCLTPAIDGIFRPGGGRLRTDSRDVQDNLPVLGKNWSRARDVASMADGGNLFG